MCWRGQKVHILLGGDIYGQNGKPIQLKSGPTLHPSLFGYIALGKCAGTKRDSEMSCFVLSPDTQEDQDQNLEEWKDWGIPHSLGLPFSAFWKTGLG